MSERSGVWRVLVVDDSDDFRAAVRSWIATQPGLRLCGVAAGGEEALRAIDAHAPDLVLMDAFMPGLDGFDATRRIKAATDAPRVVMLSVHEGTQVEQESWAAGADAFVPKSQFATRLPQVIRSLLAGEGQQPRERDRSRRPSADGPAERSAAAQTKSFVWGGACARSFRFV